MKNYKILFFNVNTQKYLKNLFKKSIKFINYNFVLKK